VGKTSPCFKHTPELQRLGTGPPKVAPFRATPTRVPDCIVTILETCRGLLLRILILCRTPLPPPAVSSLFLIHLCVSTVQGHPFLGFLFFFKVVVYLNLLQASPAQFNSASRFYRPFFTQTTPFCLYQSHTTVQNAVLNTRPCRSREPGIRYVQYQNKME
jgi:hypothetical protein